MRNKYLPEYFEIFMPVIGVSILLKDFDCRHQGVQSLISVAFESFLFMSPVMLFVLIGQIKTPLVNQRRYFNYMLLKN
jgi:hypothetical protein